MSYDIDAWLEDGRPRLHIIDADSGAVRLAWTYRKPEEDPDQDTELSLERLAIRELFRELFLLSSLRGLKVHGGAGLGSDPPCVPGPAGRAGKVIRMDAVMRRRGKRMPR